MKTNRSTVQPAELRQARSYLRREVHAYSRMLKKPRGMETEYERLRAILEAGPEAIVSEYRLEQRRARRQQKRCKTAAVPAPPKPWWHGMTDEERAAVLGKHLREEDFREFSVVLETARAMWRKYPELVESAEIPELYAVAFRDVLGEVPTEVAFEDVFSPVYPEKCRQSALRVMATQNAA